MKIAVTGSNGFLGREVTARLINDGHQLTLIDRSSGIDVRSPDLIKAVEHQDAVIHLAGMLGTAELFDPIFCRDAIDVNIFGAVNVLDCCRRTGAKYLAVTLPKVWYSVYRATKEAADIIARGYNESYGVPVAFVCAYNAFGPGQAHGDGHPRKIVPAFSTESWAGVPITVWGDGHQTVDLVSTRDIAEVFARAVAYGDFEGETYDAGTGSPMSVNHVASLINDITGSTAGVRHLPMRTGERPGTAISATGRGWDTLDWHPSFNMADLRLAVESYRDHAPVLVP